MHTEARDFTLFVKKILHDYFINKKVLDVGSGDINGNNRFLFENCTYDGNDVIRARNVTIVSKTKDLPFENSTFDTILSTECFEHDPEYKESFSKIYNMLKPDGLFCFTCASTGRGEHGTRRSQAGDSYGTIGGLEDMSDYYKNGPENVLPKVDEIRKGLTERNIEIQFEAAAEYMVDEGLEDKIKNNEKRKTIITKIPKVYPLI